MKRGAAAPPASRLIAGIDEAGLGPLLGPLTIGWSVLRLPRPQADPWELLAPTVERAPRRGAKLVVADSKRVYARSRPGLERLERTVLTFLALLDPEGRPPSDAHALLHGPLGPAADLLAAIPWYATLPAVPRVLDPGAVELGAALLDRRLRGEGLALVDAGVRTVPARELNASFDATGNKGATTWSFCADILRHLWRNHGEEGPDVTVDLLGGRRHYGGLLARAFPDARVSTLFEDEEHSAYLLDESGRDAASRWEPRRMRVDFRAKGEEASFPVALSSCLAKYVRELVMAGFNRYFGALSSDLAPTAGYTTDGRRWLEDARDLLESNAIPRHTLVRSR
ncbi:MAG TPA: hypothetical protein ENJ09_07265 [Planctomycetes bacterium]|nr:hypothetical protein [Planctomycetota bacterium]